MGSALSLGLGAQGKKVIVCGGDTTVVMHMGGLTTAGRYVSEIDLTYILFDNEQNKSTGGQNTYQSHLDYSNIVRGTGCGVFGPSIKTVDDFESVLADLEVKFLLG